MSDLKIDVHIHLAGTGCKCSGIKIHPQLRKRYTIKLLQWMHHISNRQMDEDFDVIWPEKISQMIKNSEVDYGVVLGFDGAYDYQTGDLDESRSQLVIPSAWVFAVCKEHPYLLPGPSINPHKKDAIKDLEYCIQEGACLIKWLPSAQLIDPKHPKLKLFYRLCREAHMPLLIHCGGERTFASLKHELNDFHRIRAALDEGVTVICAHSGTKVIGSREEDQEPFILEAFKSYPHLWIDNSGLCNPSRYAHVPRLGKSPAMKERTLYGSDFPVPPMALLYPMSMGLKRMWQTQSIENPISRDIAIKRFFGFEEQTLTRASGILANLNRWVSS